MSFDDNAQVPKFLDYTLARHKQFPDAAKPVPTQRFMRFPGQPMAEVADTRARLPRLSPHGKNEFCPATPPKARGTLVARVWGRRVEKNGRLCESCISQENYIEDIFDVPNEMQREIARLANDGQRFRLPENFVRHLATYTYLGQLDVRPRVPAGAATPRAGACARVVGRARAQQREGQPTLAHHRQERRGKQPPGP